MGQREVIETTLREDAEDAESDRGRERRGISILRVWLRSCVSLMTEVPSTCADYPLAGNRLRLRLDQTHSFSL